MGNLFFYYPNPFQTTIKNNACLSVKAQTGVYCFFILRGLLQSRQFLFYFDDFVRFDEVTDFKVIEIINRHTAFKT